MYDGIGKDVLKIAATFVLICLFFSCSRSCSRSERNMVCIKDGYCYDKDTQVIYIESYGGRYATETIYAPYFDTDGNLCKYDVETGEWIPIDD